MIEQDDFLIIENEIEEILLELCEKYRIKDIYKIEPMRWKIALKMIHDRLIAPNKDRLLMDDKNSYIYDKEKFYNMYNLYKEISYIYLQEITISNLYIFLGISLQSIYNMSNGIKALDKLTLEGIDIIQIIKRDNEDSLFDLMRSDDAKKTTAYISKLNGKHGWNSEKRKGEAVQVAVITSSELPNLAKKEE